MRVNWSRVDREREGYARRLLAISAEARAALHDAGRRAVARLGVQEDLAGSPLTDLLAGFAARCPRVRLDTTSAWSAELRRALDVDDLDLALVNRDADGGRCLARAAELGRWPVRRPLAARVVPAGLLLPSAGRRSD